LLSVEVSKGIVSIDYILRGEDFTKDFQQNNRV